MIGAIFTLLILYQVKHFLADYPLQRDFMLGKFKDGYAWIVPLLAHVAVHGVFTLFIAMSFFWFIHYTDVHYWCVKLAFIDMTIHFVMDRIKASGRLLGRYKPLTAPDYIAARTDMANTSQVEMKWWHARRKLKDNTYFWWSLGFDQTIHALTHIYLVYKMVQLVYFGI